MPRAPDQIPENIDFAAQELLEAPADEHPAMLEGIAKALTRWLLQDEPGLGSLERFRSAHHGFVKRLGSGEGFSGTRRRNDLPSGQDSSAALNRAIRDV
jgi:hypothetical protein